MDESAPLDHRAIMTAMAGIMLAILTAALDQTVVTPALTKISSDLHALDRLSWVVVAYFLTATALTPIYGKLGDLYGRGRVMLTAIVIFMVASAACAAAQDLAQLVAARAVQGIGGGGLIVLAQAMVADFISPRERGRYQGYIASMWAFAGIAGPPVGGLLAEHLSWRWIFWINLPLGVLTFVLCRRAAARLRAPSRRRGNIDVAGALLLIVSVSLLVFWTSDTATGPWLLASGIAVAAAFVWRELHASEPVLPPRLYRNPVIVMTNITGFLISVLQFSALVLIPVYFQLVGGMGVAAGGLMVVPMLAGIPIAATTSGLIMLRTGRYKPIIPIACLLMATAFAFLALNGVGAPLGATILAIGLLGLGVGSSGPVIMTATQNAAESRDVGVATASIGFVRALGASFGTAFFWAVLLAAGGGRIRDAAQPGFHDVFALAAVLALVTAAVALALREEPLKTAPRTRLATAGGYQAADQGGPG